MGSMTMEVRPLDTTHSAGIRDSLALFKLVYGRDMTEQFYRWRFVDNPFGPPLVSLLWDADLLVGHYSVCPTRMLVQSRTILGGQSMTTMTHPDYRNRGVFTLLANDLYRRMLDMRVQLVWGFPNTNSHHGFVHKLGWTDIGLVVTLTCHLARFVSTSAAVTDTAQVPPYVTDLCMRLDDGRIHPSLRDAAYMQWRYLDNPVQRYRLFALPASTDAFVVAKDYDTLHGKSLELVECLCTPEATIDVLHGVLGWAKDNGYALARVWVSLKDAAFSHYERCGFVPSEPVTYFGGRSLDTAVLRATDWTLERWCVTMGNSDNY
jgi:GNAT superfamily N-acetyltransferase